MEYVIGALLLHKLGEKITVENLKKVIEAAGANFDEAKAKALVASLENVNIEEAISKVPEAAPAPAPKVEKPKEEVKKEEEAEEEEKRAAEGLGALFG